jgi:hypothetical protein
MTSKMVIVAASLTVAAVLHVQQSPVLQRQLSTDQLREDFAILRSSLEEGHGGIYRYSTKSQMDEVFETAERAIDAPMTELEFYRLLAPVVASLNDGHTGLTGSHELERQFSQEPVIFPFKIAYHAGEAFLHRNYSDNADIEMGGKVLSINGRSMGDVLAAILPMLPSDGTVETSKYRRLERTNQFGDTYGRVFGITTHFDLTYRAPQGGAVRSVAVDGITAAELNRRFESRYADISRAEQNRPPVQLTYRNGVPILTVRTFGGRTISNAGIDYPAFLQNAFRDLAERQVEHLIIDVRNNGGGSDEYGKLLAAYLIPEPFDYYRFLEVNSDSFAFLEHTRMSNGDVPRDRLRANERGKFDLLGHPNLGTQQPLQPNFSGEAYILINGASFSATGEFTSVVHHHGRATFVGEECGAGYYGNTSGMMVGVTLPNSGISVRVPLVRYTMAVSGYEPADRGLIPEHHVEPTIEDLLAGRDTVLEYTLELIGG